MAVIVPAGIGRLSRAARSVVARAAQTAAAEGSLPTDTGHLLIALAEDDQDVSDFLRTVGARLPTLREALAGASSAESVSEATRRRRSSRTAEADAALMRAVILAGRPRQVSAEHLLASLCRGAPSRAQDVLAGLGVRSSDVRVFFDLRRAQAA